jgi:hypothetical protein
MSAVSCALIQQWCDEYLKYAHPRAAPHERGRVRTYLYRGLDQFQMRRFMYGTYVLLHISVFLFFWALSDFFDTIHHDFGVVTRYALVESGIFYILLSISPLIFSNSPYNTPMTPPIAFPLTRCAQFSPATFFTTNPHRLRSSRSSRTAPLRSLGSGSIFARSFRRCLIDTVRALMSGEFFRRRRSFVYSGGGLCCSCWRQRLCWVTLRVRSMPVRLRLLVC